MAALTPAEFKAAVQALVDHEAAESHGWMTWDQTHSHPMGNHEHLSLLTDLLKELGYEEGIAILKGSLRDFKR